jgi:ribosomal protein S12 methylthiotransferase accessory factor YcaO
MPFVEGAFIMPHMASPQGEQSRRAVSSEKSSRRKRAAVSAHGDQFERAFADALRDILKHERRIAA